MSSRRFHRVCKLAMFVALSTAVCAPLKAQQSGTAPLSKAQLEQLVAPIALHPDPLLSQMLMASTYPTEVVQAARWRRENANVSGQALQEALKAQPWDPSVRALTAVPETLQMMSDKLDWTQQLGDAFLGQQEDLLAAVQRLRQRAEAAGNLRTTEQQKVSTVATPTAAGTAPKIVIEPANPEYVSVPVYDPRLVYGDWPYADYEPFYWYPAGFTGGGLLSFATAVAVGSAIWGNLDWRRNRADINVNRFNQFNRTNIADRTWRHNPRHRGNVPYRNANVAQRFGDANRAAAREAYRGKAEAGRRDIGKGNVGQGAGAGKAKVAQGAGAGKAKAKVGQAGGAGKAKSAAAAHAKQAGRAKSAGAQTRQAAKPRSAANAPRQAARSRPASRPTAQRPQARAYRSMGGGGRAFHGGGGHRGGVRGGGGRRGRR